MDGFDGVNLTPQEGFILSRIDGHSSVDDICMLAGLARKQTLAALVKLHQSQLIEIPGGPEPEPAATTAPGASPAATAGPEPTVPTPPDGSPAAASQPEAADPGGPLEDEAGEIPEFFPDPACQIPEPRQREIHQLYHQLEDMDFYELLSLEPGCSARDVQRAYRKIALKFHPDRFYGKELGEYKGRLDTIFRHMSNVADYLDDDEQRASYETEAVLPARRAGTASPAAVTPAPDAKADGRDDAAPDPATGSQSASAAKALDTQERAAMRASRKLSREERLRRLGGVLGMSTQEIKAVKRKKRTPRTGEVAAQTAPALSEERQQRLEKDRRRATKKALNPLVQRKQKAKLHFDEGVKAMLAGKWTAAASNLKLATTFDPKNNEYREKERIASARAREESAKSYAKRAALEAGVGRWDEAARLYKMAAERHDSIDNLTQAADALTRLGELKLAVEYATKAKDLDPNSVPARLALANAYLAASMPKNARREVDYALKLDSDSRVAKALLKEIRKRD